MSDTIQCVKGGIAITWKIENFLSIQNIWWTFFPLEWVDTKSKWKIEMKFSSCEGNKKCIRLIIDKLDKLEPSCLKGTISVVNENSAFELKLLEHNFLDSKEKHLWLTPSNGTDFETEDLINNDSITLRFTLWDLNINDLIAAEYFIRSTYTEQKCSYQWTIKKNTDWKRIDKYLESSKEIPMEFIDFSSMIKFALILSLQMEGNNLHANLQVKNSPGKSQKRNKSFVSNYFWIRGKYSIKVQTKNELQLLDTDWKDIQFMCFRNNKNLISEEGFSIRVQDWIVKTEIIIVTDCAAMIEKICNEPTFKNLGETSSTPKRRKLSKDTLKSSIYSLYQDRKFCDVVIRTDNKTFHCHKNILSARSTVFRRMFVENSIENKANLITINNVDSRIFDMFLKFLYSDNLEHEDFNSMMKLYPIANNYSVQNLKEICASTIVSCLSTENVCQALDLADQHEDEDLKERILSFISENTKEIINSSSWKTFLLSNPLLAAKTSQALFNKILK